METLTLVTPESKPICTDYRVVRLDLNWRHASIHIELQGINGEQKHHDYSGPVATNLMIFLNKTNLTVKSLHRRVLERLVTDGVLIGSVTGSPD